MLESGYRKMQPTLFDPSTNIASLNEMILFALGEFQSRGHRLAERELALDRLRHAVDRACDRFRIEPPADEKLAALFEKAGAQVVEIPNYFAKRPFRITVSEPLATSALTVYHRLNGKHS